MSRWGFVVSAVKNRLSGGKATYAARVRHKDVLRGEELFKEMADYMAINPVLAAGLINGLGGFVQAKLKQGYKLDFGLFKAGLTIRGGFDAVNDGFRLKRNQIAVSLSPGVRLKRSVANLVPENLTAALDPVIQSVCGGKDVSGNYTIVIGEKSGINGKFPSVCFQGEDDGVWLEDESGDRLADAEILSAETTRIDFRFDERTPPGLYRLVVGFRSGTGAAVATDELRVKVIPSSASKPPRRMV